MFWLSLAADVGSWSARLWQHRQSFEPLLHKLGDAASLAQAALTNPNGILRRVGNTLVFGQPDGGQKVLAFIEQTSPRLENIERAVNGLQAGQTALSSSLGSLQNLSMITLGFTALSHGVLHSQFRALNRRLDVLGSRIADLHKKFDAAILADLNAGLELLHFGQDFVEVGDHTNAHDRLTAALPLCIRTKEYFSSRLGDTPSQGTATVDEVRLLARHLSVAVAGVAGCHIGLGQDKHAFARSGAQLDLMRQAGRWVFDQTVGREPGQYLLPEMREYGVTIEFMAHLFQQARDAWEVEPSQDASVSAWFEAHREAIFQTRRPWRPAAACEALNGQLRAAVAAVEEINRIVGLSRLVDQLRASGQSVLTAMEECRKQRSAQDPSDTPFAVWAWPEAPSQ